MTTQTINGTGQSDTLIGANNINDIINGGNGSDFIFGGSGDDKIKGGKGDDILRGGAGDDIIQGGSGNDDARGGDGNDILDGGSGNDIVRGSTGNDIVRGGTGNDLVTGDEGDDTIIGSYIFPETGDDLTAPEIDRLYGGSGSDIFVLATQDRLFYSLAAGNDYGTIFDFSIAEQDTIRLKGSASDYQFSSVGSDTKIFSGTDLIAIVKGVDSFAVANNTSYV
jgi:Ca2+-binding RTX toxin-like protein